MAHFAKIENDIVVEVIRAEQDFIDTLDGEWVQTSYNTYCGVHIQGGTPLRKNFAAIGYTYDRQRDAFIPPPEDFPSWTLNENTCCWEAPTPKPQDFAKTYHRWDEDTLSWVKLIWDKEISDWTEQS